MDQFSIRGENGFIKIILGEIFAFPDPANQSGGLAIRSVVEIKSYGYSAKGPYWTTTKEILGLYENLKKANEEIAGEVRYDSYESNIQMILRYTDLGQVYLIGKYIERHDREDTLEFKIKTDQTFISTTLDELRLIEGKWGDIKGIK